MARGGRRTKIDTTNFMEYIKDYEIVKAIKEDDGDIRVIFNPKYDIETAHNGVGYAMAQLALSMLAGGMPEELVQKGLHNMASVSMEQAKEMLKHYQDGTAEAITIDDYNEMQKKGLN